MASSCFLHLIQNGQIDLRLRGISTRMQTGMERDFIKLRLIPIVMERMHSMMQRNASLFGNNLSLGLFFLASPDKVWNDDGRSIASAPAQDLGLLSTIEEVDIHDAGGFAVPESS